MYELPHELPNELPNDLRLQESLKTLKNESLVLSPPAKMKILLKLAKNSSKAVIRLFPQCTILHKN